MADREHDVCTADDAPSPVDGDDENGGAASDREGDVLPRDGMAKRPESMPPMVHIDGDFNANTILDRKCSVSNPVMHLIPRREGRVLLPNRYQIQLKAYKEKRAESKLASGCPPTTDSNPKCLSSQAKIADPEGSDHPNETRKPEGMEAPDSNNTDSSVSDKWSDRLEDLDVALRWIRQELIQMKQEDRFLMRQLLDLTARIHLIQGRPPHLSFSANLALLGSCGSDLDIATWSSFMSLDDQVLLERSNAADSTTILKELMTYVNEGGNRLGPPTAGTLARGLRGYGDGLSDMISRSASTREAIRPPLKIRRKNSLPTENEMEEDHFFDDDSD